MFSLGATRHTGQCRCDRDGPGRESAPDTIQQILTTQISDFLSRSERAPPSPVTLDVRVAFNPNDTTSWFTSVMGIINNVTMLAIILSGAAVVREREHGTMDHLLVMPVTPFEIAMSKVWANGLVITLAVALSLSVVVRALLGIPVAGSVILFLAGVVIYLFFATAIGIFLATVARTMPQLGLLYLLVATPMNILSGAIRRSKACHVYFKSSWRYRLRRISCRSLRQYFTAAPVSTWCGQNSWPSHLWGVSSSVSHCCDFAGFRRNRLEWALQ